MSNQNSSQLDVTEHYDVVVIGGGAAGLMCAITAGQRGRRVLVLESSNKLGKKILMSGGGRCNFTNLDIQMDCFISTNPHFFKSALSQYTQWDFISLVAKHAIKYHEKEQGQLFCDESAKQIVSMLQTECDSANVSVQLDVNLETVSWDESQQIYTLSSDHGQYQCQSVVIATGGLSIPSLGGATGFGYEMAKQFDLPLIERIASLVPMTLTGRWQDFSNALTGVALPVIVSVPRKSFTSSMLFTHRGLSGPAILQLSNYWQVGEEINIELMPELSLEELQQRFLSTKKSAPNLLLKTYLGNFLPKAFCNEFLQDYWQHCWKDKGKDPAQQTMQGFKVEELNELALTMKNWQIKPSGTEGYRTAEVTKGGVDVNNISSKTMEVKHQVGLYFIGEVLDVTGHLGGYNFQWAWSSGYVAGLNV